MDLLATGCNVVEEIEEGSNNKDAVIFMNNHPMYTKIQLSKLLNSMNGSPLFFDGWNQFVSTEVERVNNSSIQRWVIYHRLHSRKILVF